MAEVINLFEAEPAASSHGVLTSSKVLKFQPFVNSLQFWFLQAKRKKPSVCSWHKNRLNAWAIKTLKSTTKGTRLMIVVNKGGWGASAD